MAAAASSKLPLLPATDGIRDTGSAPDGFLDTAYVYSNVFSPSSIVLQMIGNYFNWLASTSFWLILLPFRLVGIVVGGTFELIAALFSLPGRMLRAI